MPRKKPHFERADIRAAWEMMIALGRTPVSVTVKPDGTFRVVTTDYIEAKYGKPPVLTAAAINPWDEVLK